MPAKKTEAVTAGDLEEQGWKSHALPGHMGQVGPMWTRKTGDGSWAYGLLAGAQHLNPAGVVHGGALLSLVDHAISTVAWELCDRMPCVTVQLDSHFTASLCAGQFAAVQPTVLHRSAGLVFLRAELRTADQLVLSAQAIMKVLRPA